MEIYDVIIIGAGPAGMTAAVYASRAELKTLILEAGAPGGKMLKTMEIGNWPGIVEAKGPQLAMEMYKHSTAFGAKFDMGDVERIDLDGDIKVVKLANGKEFRAKTVIYATGTKERTLHIPGREKMEGRGISYCAICDGAFFRNRDVVVVGGGNSALEESLHLTSLVNKVYLIQIMDSFNAEKITVDKVMANDKIEIHMESEVIEVLERENKMGGVLVRNNKTGDVDEIMADGMFIYIGADPVTAPIAHLGITDEHGYILVNDKMETSVPGIYGAGDVNSKVLRQIVTAVNDGAIAAQEALAYIQKSE
ncbi:thioredoxin-disulfide reductase [Culicoidibacter larvae]|uniref:Thioredoxin reductase n=1 Tax=Culicoidibacter larvae TaxID=2579976 RepID=A0A5R8QIV5_9FIRM|nr:thioredoxin-disulfide reductase [Culicoidibacter larvae]TLG77383.1 thioredoxin-disulfide reductase [Culicoidibacter larvae]